ncbi:probable serine/threonine-protein kinase DDB_G0277449 [Zootermopsis nevadensis]|uniref:non-specific serine/threonine protein kinase n=1 Tax=Zootermopsis nevadensis TaxID=136037 RepID=A0A067QUK6_ZOONE|nr:probable serine/threonine-protein kinase DDB_G0277449 [Zootermopsis nevadensis]KDR09423.1 Chromosomal serine/threonine-protein kinase JIL-1 [Zootermopsis nevadensis]
MGSIITSINNGDDDSNVEYKKFYFVHDLHDDAIYTLKITPTSVRNRLTERLMYETIGDAPFIAKLHYAFETESKNFLLLDYLPGDTLSSILRNIVLLTEDEVRYYIAEIVLAVEHLHKIQIIHRDLKPDNILLDANGHIAVANFGSSVRFRPRNKVKPSKTFRGTEPYVAPEIVEFQSYNKAVDWWSVGVITYQLLTGEVFFEAMDGRKMKMLYKKFQNHARIKQMKFSPEVTDFITRLLTKDPRERLGALKYGTQRIKAHPFFYGINWEDVAQKTTVMPFVPSPPDAKDVCLVDENYRNKFYPQSSTTTQPKKCSKTAKKLKPILKKREEPQRKRKTAATKQGGTDDVCRYNLRKRRRKTDSSINMSQKKRR